MPTWQFQEAKRRLSDVIDLAISEGPQVVTRSGRDVVVILSVEEYQHLLKKHSAQIAATSALNYLIDQPTTGQRSKASIDADLDAERDW